MNLSKYQLTLQRDELTESMEQLDYDVLAFGFWKQKDLYILKNDILSHYKLIFLVQGRCTISFRKQDYVLKSGDALLVSPFVLYTATCMEGDPVEFYYFHFNPKNDSCRERFNALFYCAPAAIYTEAIPEAIYQIIELVYRKSLSDHPGNYFSAKLLLQRVLLDIKQFSRPYPGSTLPQYKTSGAERVIGRCLQYVDSHLSERVTVAQLCAYIHVSQSYLYQVFMDLTGYSTKDFLDYYKLRRIQTELTRTALSMHEIADKYGFSSVYAFSNHFKKNMGISPTQYRKQQI